MAPAASMALLHMQNKIACCAHSIWCLAEVLADAPCAACDDLAIRHSLDTVRGGIFLADAEWLLRVGRRELRLTLPPTAARRRKLLVIWNGAKEEERPIEAVARYQEGVDEELGEMPNQAGDGEEAGAAEAGREEGQDRDCHGKGFLGGEDVD